MRIRRKRPNPGGNYCGHKAKTPTLNLLASHDLSVKPLPAIIKTLAQRVKAYFDSPRVLIPSLNLANGCRRQQRSERREACIVVLQVLLKYLDLTTLNVGIPTPKGFCHLPLKTLFRQTGLHPRRCQRALHNLKIAGLISLTPRQTREDDGSWTSLVAIKRISSDLFTLFNLSKALKKERRKAKIRQQAKEQAWVQQTTPTYQSIVHKTRLNLVVNMALQSNTTKQPKQIPTQVPNPPWMDEQPPKDPIKILNDILQAACSRLNHT